MGDERYPPIEEYAFLGDGHAAALVAATGSVDWCCLPRLDSSSVFGRLLDWDRGGHCLIAPVQPAEMARYYIDDSLVLVTEWRVGGGEVRVVDLLARGGGPGEEHRSELLRIIEGVRGDVALTVHVAPRFDYAELAPWIRRAGERRFVALGGDDALDIGGDIPLELVGRHDLHADVVVPAGTRVRLRITWLRPERCDEELPALPGAAELDRRVEATVAWWGRWSDGLDLSAAGRAGVARSAATLKGLINEPTGAVAAAATTSLPEGIGSARTWDYRYCWVRDSQFTTRTLGRMGCGREADAFRRFVERSAAGGADALQVLYGLGGERRLTELELGHLDGYRGSRPVRVGNVAADQLQLDVHGYLLDQAWQAHGRGLPPDDDYWRFLVDIVDRAVDLWDRPDRGIWEVRSEPRHFVHSKVMCWVAADRGVRLAEADVGDAPVRRWSAARDAIRAAVESDGYDGDRGTFRRIFGEDGVDSALLLLPSFGFVDYDDERMVRTTDRIRDELDDHGLLRRYRADDGLDGEEGAFIACTFWLAECLALQGRPDEAAAAFDRAAATGNDLGIFAEQYDPVGRCALGNVPQGLTHLSHIAAALALGRHNDGDAG